MDSVTLRLRVFGRICYVFDGLASSGANKAEKLHVIAVDMTRNPLLRVPAHFVMLTVPMTCIEAFSRRPDATSFSNHDNAEEVEEFYLWNLEQCDIAIEGLSSGPGFVEKAFVDQHELPFLNERLAVMKVGDAEFDDAALTNPINSAAACVLSVASGSIRPFSPLGPRTITYERLEGAGIETSREGVADGAELVLPADGSSVTFRIRRRSDGLIWTVTVGKDAIFQGVDPIVTLSNTCGCQVNRSAILRDEEFAAYYELLKAPPPPGDRLIPTTTGQLTAGGCDIPSAIRR